METEIIMKFVKNTSANPVLLSDLTRLAPGEVREVEAVAVGSAAIASGVIQFVDGEVVEAPVEVPDVPVVGGALTVQEVADRLFANPELIPDDGFISSGAPSVEALEEVFGQDFDAVGRDAVWEKVQGLKSGSFLS